MRFHATNNEQISITNVNPSHENRTSDNQAGQEIASKQLRSDTYDYRLAKSNMNDQIAGLFAGAVINSQPRDQ